MAGGNGKKRATPKKPAPKKPAPKKQIKTMIATGGKGGKRQKKATGKA